jgi:hypothetical protein
MFAEDDMDDDSSASKIPNNFEFDLLDEEE